MGAVNKESVFSDPYFSQNLCSQNIRNQFLSDPNFLALQTLMRKFYYLIPREILAVNKNLFCSKFDPQTIPWR